MPKKQTRRAISLRQTTYEAIQRKAEELGTSGSGWVESVVRPLLGLEPEESAPRREPRLKVAPTPPAATPPPTPTAPIPAKVLKAEPPPPKIVKKEFPVKKDIPKDDKADKIFTF